MTTHDTFVLERRYPHPPARVFAALATPAAKRRWFAAGDHHDVISFAMDFRAGGRERAHYCMRAGTPFPGVEFTHEAEFVDIVPGERVVTAAVMDFAGRRISATLVTMELSDDGIEGTRLVCTHQGAFFEGADGPVLRQAGFVEILKRLGVELDKA